MNCLSHPHCAKIIFVFLHAGRSKLALVGGAIVPTWYVAAFQAMALVFLVQHVTNMVKQKYRSYEPVYPRTCCRVGAGISSDKPSPMNVLNTSICLLHVIFSPLLNQSVRKPVSWSPFSPLAEVVRHLALRLASSSIFLVKSHKSFV